MAFWRSYGRFSRGYGASKRRRYGGSGRRYGKSVRKGRSFGSRRGRFAYRRKGYRRFAKRRQSRRILYCSKLAKYVYKFNRIFDGGAPTETAFGGVSGTNRQAWFMQYVHSLFDMLLMAYDQALRRYKQDRMEKLPATAAGYRFGATGNSELVNINPAHSLTARLPRYNPSRFAVKLWQTFKTELTNPTTYKQYVKVYLHQQRRSFFTDPTYKPITTQYISDILDDSHRYNFQTGGSNDLTGGNSNTLVKKSGCLPDAKAWDNYNNAGHNYLEPFQVFSLDTGNHTLMNMGAYIQFFGADPTFNSNGATLPNRDNFFNTNAHTVATTEDKYTKPGSDTTGIATFAVMPAFGQDSASKADAVASFVAGDFAPAIAQTYIGAPFDQAAHAANGARAYWSDVNGATAAGTFSVSMPSLGVIAVTASSNSDWSNSTSSTLGSTTVGANKYPTANDVNRLLAYDEKTWNQGYGRGTDQDANKPPDSLPALNGAPTTVGDDDGEYISHLNYKHEKNVLFRRVYKLRGQLKFTINPGERVSFTIKAPKRIVKGTDYECAIYHLSRVLPNGHMKAIDATNWKRMGDYPTFERGVTAIKPLAFAKADVAGSTFYLMSVTGQRAIDQNRTGDATMCGDLTATMTYSAAYKYCLLAKDRYLSRPPNSTRTQWLRATDKSVSRATAETQYRIPAPPNRYFLSGSTDFTASSIRPGRATG